jgi:hypothetical protein
MVLLISDLPFSVTNSIITSVMLIAYLVIYELFISESPKEVKNLFNPIFISLFVIFFFIVIAQLFYLSSFFRNIV